MCTEPSSARSRIERMESCSTVPDSPPTVIRSPTATASSSRRNTPVMMSRTSVCEPKPMASPITPAPASSGAMFTPICASVVSPTTTASTTPSAVRASGSSVRTRAERAAAPSFGRAARLRWIAAFASSHSTSATVTVMAMEVTEATRREPGRPSRKKAKAGSPQLCSASTTAKATMIAEITPFSAGR